MKPITVDHSNVASHLNSVADLYAEQTSAIVPEWPDTWVATFTIAADGTGRPASFCAWTEGVPALLPQAQFIAFLRHEGGRGEFNILGVPDWETVQRLAGHLMQPQHIIPERWLVREFPDEALLKQILSAAGASGAVIRRFAP